MTKSPAQATVTVSPYRLVRILNLSSLHGELDRLYFEITDNQLDAYGFRNGLVSYCSFNQYFVDRIESQRNDAVGVIVDVPSWQDTASRLNTSRKKPRTVLDHDFHRSITGAEKREERRRTFYEQYTDGSPTCMIELHCERGSDLASRRTIISGKNRYEDPLPTPRLTLVYWDQVHNIMATYGVDSISVDGYMIRNKFNREYKGIGVRTTNIFSTPKNKKEYGDHDLFYSDKISCEKVANALWSEIKTEIRRRSPWWVYDSISTPDSEICFEVSKLRKIDKLFDKNNRFRSPVDYSPVPSGFETDINELEKLVETYDMRWSPPYPIESRDGKFVVDPEYSGTGTYDMTATDITGPPFRTEVLHLDSVVNSLSGKVEIWGGPDVPCIGVVHRDRGMILRYILPILK